MKKRGEMIKGKEREENKGRKRRRKVSERKNQLMREN